ncbi:MAG: DUF4157 domain-containing protein [Myxococcota bacterium]
MSDAPHTTGPKDFTTPKLWAPILKSYAPKSRALTADAPKADLPQADAPQTSTSRVPVQRLVQLRRKHGITGAHVLAHRNAVQMKRVAAPSDTETVHQAAASGLTGSAQPLPHLDTIQDAFGKHDVSKVQAFVGGPAASAAARMGAHAYATGNNVAFGTSPDLHTAAHEAAHVVQQRTGFQLQGGVGQVGDRYEQHADAVADAVVAGRSAETLLDAYAPMASPQADMLQQQAVQLSAVQVDGVTWELVVGPIEGGGEGVVATPPTPEQEPLTTFQVAQLLGLSARAVTTATTPHHFHVPETDLPRLRTRLNTSSASEAPPDQDVEAFAQSFQQEFPPNVLTVSGVPTSRSDDESWMRPLFDLFSTEQRQKLLAFTADHVVPERLFNGSNAGQASIQQRILISAHMLAVGTWQPEAVAPQVEGDQEGAQEQRPTELPQQGVIARSCLHWTQLVFAYAGVNPPGGEGHNGVQHTFDHAGNIILGQDNPGDVRAVGGAAGQLNNRGGSGRAPVQPDSLQPGDWLEIAWGDHVGGSVPGATPNARTHSVILSRIIDLGDPEFRIAYFSQAVNPYREEDRGDGTTVSRRQAGTRREEEKTCSRVLGRNKPVIYGYHRINDGGQAESDEELLPNLGGGSRERRNRNFLNRGHIQRALGRRRGRTIDLDEVCAWAVGQIHTRNGALINTLYDTERMSDEQKAVLDHANLPQERNFQALERVLRLNDRLRIIEHNLQLLEASNDHQTRTVERIGRQRGDEMQPGEQSWITHNNQISQAQLIGDSTNGELTSARTRPTRGLLALLQPQLDWSAFSSTP